MLVTSNFVHGDCLEVMKDFPDNSVDLVICDLPFATTQNSWDSMIPLQDYIEVPMKRGKVLKMNKKDYVLYTVDTGNYNEADMILYNFEKNKKPGLWSFYHRIVKENGAIILFAQSPFNIVLGNSNMKELRYEWIWKKENGTGFLNAKKMPLKIHENILVFYRSLPTFHPQMRKGFKAYTCKQGSGSSSWNYDETHGGHITSSNGERYPIDILEYARDKNNIHPTQKPTELLQYLISSYSDKGDTILDNCSGSGSTGIACMATDRNFIGIEKEEKYYKASLARAYKFIDDYELDNIKIKETEAITAK